VYVCVCVRVFVRVCVLVPPVCTLGAQETGRHAYQRRADGDQIKEVDKALHIALHKTFRAHKILVGDRLALPAQSFVSHFNVGLAVGVDGLCSALHMD